VKKQLKAIREVFWPMLDPLPENEESEVDEITIHIEEDNLEMAFDLKIKMTENEEDRRKGVESKAALLLSSIGLATTLVLGANSFVGTDNYLWTKVILGLLCIVLCIYTLMTVLYSMKCLARASYHRLAFSDINITGKPHDYRRKLLKKMNGHIRENQVTINEKVDYMVMSQEFYLRSLIVIFIYAVLGIALSLMKPSKPASPEPLNTPHAAIMHDSTAHFMRQP
jgi:hypothetical protein